MNNLPGFALALGLTNAVLLTILARIRSPSNGQRVLSMALWGFIAGYAAGWG